MRSLKKTGYYYYLTFVVILNLCSLHINVWSRDQVTITKNSSTSGLNLPACNAVHNVGKLLLKSNSATFFGRRLEDGQLSDEGQRDCITNQHVFEYGAEYPKNSNIATLSTGVILVGGIIKNDTLVTRWQYTQILSEKLYRSTLSPNSSNFEDAVSEQDYLAVSVDNKYDNQQEDFGFNHKPLDIQITKKSYAWSYEYAEDFVLFDIEIKNIGNQTIKESYVGLWLNFDVGYFNGTNIFNEDDLSGFYRHSKSLNDCNNIRDNIDIMWGADNDGDPINGEFIDKLTFFEGEFIKSATSVSGILFLDHLINKFQNKIQKSYNWWNDVHGPQSRTSFRKFPNVNYPTTKEDHYHLLSNGEIDYDPIYTASIDLLDEIWNYPDQEFADSISDGDHTANLYSVGPFDIPPGAVLKLPFAYVAGENFHTNPTNGDNLIVNPDAYYANLDFSDLVTNAQWARWIYDNPGVDTDGDGDSGQYTVCVLDSQFIDNEWVTTAADTFWYRGDGIPDWKAAGPPPAPFFWLNPTLNGIHVRLNGSRSETEKDIFTRIADFEGYNIYFGRDERESSLSLVASYDKENYDKFVYSRAVERYIVEDIPMTLKEIRCVYADSCSDETFEPLLTSASSPIFVNDSIIYFEKHSFNVETSAITKVFPNVRDPRTVHVDSLVDDDYTADGYFKYFEYEFTIKNLLPTVGYWVNVTAFDFGSPKSGLKALETSKTINIQNAYPLIQADELSNERKTVYIYPNPYRIDAGYRKSGYEGRTEEDRPDYRVREINFANLPPKCEIKIFSLDGDLIRHLAHDIPRSDPTFSHHQWNLITRNTQMIVSGLYYWTVEFPDGDVQIGKLVVIM